MRREEKLLRKNQETSKGCVNSLIGNPGQEAEKREASPFGLDNDGKPPHRNLLFNKEAGGKPLCPVT